MRLIFQKLEAEALFPGGTGLGSGSGTGSCSGIGTGRGNGSGTGSCSGIGTGSGGIVTFLFVKGILFPRGKALV